MGGDIAKVVDDGPKTRSAGRRVTRSSTVGALAKKKGVVESVAVAKMPPKRKRKKSVKVAKKGRLAKRERVASVDEREDEDGEWECAECGGAGTVWSGVLFLRRWISVRQSGGRERAVGVLL
jgi:hypothetical protein